jgi:dTDP-4-amino-4,6-dideoxygalactose transaminase
MMTNDNIPILDLSSEVNMLWDELNPAIQDVLRSGRFIMGEPVKQLEAELADYLDVKHAIAMNSGTDALLIGLRTFGVEAGDEVITTAFTFFATAEAVSLLGATPVFVDIDEGTFNIDANLIEANITPKTKAIIPVHLFGQAADMEKITAIAKKHDLLVLEDTAQAFGGDYGGRKLGTLGQVGAFSFFPTKNLGAYGDGGMMVTDDDGMAETAQMLRKHGAKKKYHNELLGYNSRLDTLQAAILRVKLPYVAEWNRARQQVARRYNELLAEIPGVVTPVDATGGNHVYHQYTVCILDGRRDEIKAKLAEAGIQTMVYYPIPVHKLPVYADSNVTLPKTEKAAQEVLSLPIWPFISEIQQQRVADVLLDSLMMEADREGQI